MKPGELTTEAVNGICQLMADNRHILVHPELYRQLLTPAQRIFFDIEQAINSGQSHRNTQA